MVNKIVVSSVVTEASFHVHAAADQRIIALLQKLLSLVRFSIHQMSLNLNQMHWNLRSKPSCLGWAGLDPWTERKGIQSSAIWMEETRH